MHRGKDALHNLFKSLGETLDVTDFTPLAFASKRNGSHGRDPYQRRRAFSAHRESTESWA